MPRMLKLTAAMLCLAALAFAARGSSAQTPPAKSTQSMAAAHVIVNAAQMKWAPGAPALPPGSQMALLSGDPGQPGAPFAIAAKVPDGYKVPPHWHPTDESLVIVSGTLKVGMGDTFNEASMQTLTAGGYAKLPAQMRHSVIARGETVFHVYGIGPFDLTYVNAADDPRKKTTSR